MIPRPPEMIPRTSAAIVMIMMGQAAVVDSCFDPTKRGTDVHE